MEVEAFVLNNSDCIGVVYKHETLGRVLVIRGNINPEFPIHIHPAFENKFAEIHQDMMEFILKVIPNEQKTETSTK